MSSVLTRLRHLPTFKSRVQVTINHCDPAGEALEEADDLRPFGVEEWLTSRQVDSLFHTETAAA